MKIQTIFMTRKNTDLYLIKIQISFVTKKNTDMYFNENTDQFYEQKKYRFVFNENTDQIFFLKVLMIISRFSNQRKKIKIDNQLKNMSKKIPTKYLSMTNMN